MGQFLLLLVVAAIAVGLVFGVVVLATGKDEGLRPVSPDGISIGLPPDRPLSEDDVVAARFDTGLRGYRTGQVDDALARLAYDVGFKDELIKVLVSEVQALRDGRVDDADRLRLARAKAIGESTVDTFGSAVAESAEDAAQVRGGEGPPPYTKSAAGTPGDHGIDGTGSAEAAGLPAEAPSDVDRKGDPA